MSMKKHLLNWLRTNGENGWTASRYPVFRFILGIYLAIHFGMLIPWGPELFSAEGALGDAALSPLGFFPNVLQFGAPAVSVVVLGAATLGSVAFAAGYKDRWLAIGLWYVWAALLTRNPLISNPGIPFVGWLLVMHALLPRDAEGRVVLSAPFFVGAWILMGAGYTYGGLTKIPSLSWLDGTALWHVWESPLARDTWLRAWLAELPTPLIKVMTWGTLALEIAALPLALSRKTRPWIWLGLTLMHIGILATVAFADLTVGMLMIHVVTFDPRWVTRRGRGGRSVDERGSLA